MGLIVKTHTDQPSEMHRAIASLRVIADDAVRARVAAGGMSLELFRRLADPTDDDYEHGLTAERLEREGLLQGAGGSGTADRRLSDLAAALFRETAEGAPAYAAPTATPATAGDQQVTAPQTPNSRPSNGPVDGLSDESATPAAIDTYDGFGDQAPGAQPVDGFETADVVRPAPATRDPVATSSSAFAAGSPSGF